MKVIYNKEQYEDWCFDCDYCKDKVCMHDSDCVNGSLWTPSDAEYDCDVD